MSVPDTDELEKGESLLIRFKDFLRVSMRTHQTAFAHVPFVAAGIIILTIITSVIGFLIAWSNSLLVDELVAVVGSGEVTGRLFATTFLVVGLFVLPDLISSIREYLDRIFWLKLSVLLDVFFVHARLSADIATGETPAYQDSVAKASDRGVYPILNVVQFQYAFFGDIITFLIASVVLYRFEPIYLVILAIGILPKLIVGLRYAENAYTLYDLHVQDRRKFYVMRDFPNEISRLMESHLLGLKVTIADRLKDLGESFTQRRLDVEGQRVKWDIGASIIAMVTLGIVYALGVKSVVNGSITVGAFVFLAAAVGRFGDPLSRMFASVSRQYEWARFAKELFKIFDVMPMLSLPEKPHIIEPDETPEIRMENVSFRYPGGTTDILRGLTLTIRPGEALALVGINGAGKTTLVKLLCRFYDPTEGRILINGVDLRTIDLKSWYRSLAILFQYFPEYRSFTVGEAIALGNVSIPPDLPRIREAAMDSGADTFIDAYGKKYDQLLGKEFTGGIDPSRGQEQRLALARMFYRHARCLILDEPTAAVDAETEEHIFRVIEEMKGRTRILISHRFSTVRNADQICVLDGGVVREIGTHHELMAKKGEYARLFRMQAAGYADDVGDEVVLLTGETQNPAKKKKNGMRRVAEKKNIKKEVVKGKNPPSLIHQKSSAMGS